MRRLLFVVIFAFSVLEVSAQQDPQFTQNMFNRLAVNPAYAGSSEGICGTLLAREQWTGFEGNPRTNLLSVEGGFGINTVAKRHQFGAGLTIIQDEIGPIQSINAKGALSYHKVIARGTLSLGLEFGIFNQSLQADWRTSEGNFDGTEDPRIPNSEAGATSFDLGLGLYYYTKDLYVGISSTHLNQPEISDEPDQTSSLTFQQVRHYYIMAGYTYGLGSSGFDLKPSIFVKTDAVSTQVDFNTNVEYNNLVWAGVSYRVQDAVSFLTGVNLGGISSFSSQPILKGLKVGVAYDYNISDLSDFNNGSFELMLNYCHPIFKPVKIERYKDVRFL